MCETVNTNKILFLIIQYILYAFQAKCTIVLETHTHIRFTFQHYFVPEIHIARQNFPFPFLSVLCLFTVNLLYIQFIYACLA